MDNELLNVLASCETDIEGAMKRLYGNEALYLSLLTAFTQDTTMLELDLAIHEKRWDDAFTAAHALKGLAGNMGFTSLLYATGELVLLIRAGRITEIENSLQNVWTYYREVIATIRLANMHLSKEAEK